MRATRRRTPTPSTASAATALLAYKLPRRLRRWSASRRGSGYQSVMARTRAARVSVGRGRAGARHCLINRLALDRIRGYRPPHLCVRAAPLLQNRSRRCFANVAAEQPAVQRKPGRGEAMHSQPSLLPLLAVLVQHLRRRGLALRPALGQAVVLQEALHRFRPVAHLKPRRKRLAQPEPVPALVVPAARIISA